MEERIIRGTPSAEQVNIHVSDSGMPPLGLEAIRKSTVKELYIQLKDMGYEPTTHYKTKTTLHNLTRLYIILQLYEILQKLDRTLLNFTFLCHFTQIQNYTTINETVQDYTTCFKQIFTTLYTAFVLPRFFH